MITQDERTALLARGACSSEQQTAHTQLTEGSVSGLIARVLRCDPADAVHRHAVQRFVRATSCVYGAGTSAECFTTARRLRVTEGICRLATRLASKPREGGEGGSELEQRGQHISIAGRPRAARRATIFLFRHDWKRLLSEVYLGER